MGLYGDILEVSERHHKQIQEWFKDVPSDTHLTQYEALEDLFQGWLEEQLGDNYTVLECDIYVTKDLAVLKGSYLCISVTIESERAVQESESINLETDFSL